MEFTDHLFPQGTDSYPASSVVLNFIQSYVARFRLMERIKLSHLVIQCQPIEDERWEVVVKDLPNNRFHTIVFDAVIVCNGHHFTPRIPKLPGQNLFRGHVLHSHDYRRAETLKGKFSFPIANHSRAIFHFFSLVGESVLIIGSGPSAMDLVAAIAKSAKRVTSSQHKQPNETPEALVKRKSIAPANVTLQENVKRFTETGAEFIDGTHETFTTIIYGTGYNFSFPFLSVDTGITVDDNFVQPLYKQIINIEHPTMVFIGIPFHLATTRGYDMQARFALKFLSGMKTLPPKGTMLMDMRANTHIHWNKGYRKHQSHFLGPEQQEYYRQLAEVGGIENIPDVLAAMHFDSRKSMNEDPLNYRKYRYQILDDKTFTKHRYIV